MLRTKTQLQKFLLTFLFPCSFVPHIAQSHHQKQTPYIQHTSKMPSLYSQFRQNKALYFIFENIMIKTTACRKKQRRGGAAAAAATDLLLLAREMPDSPAHVLEARAPLPAVPCGDHLDPRPVEVGLIDAGHHLLHKVPGRIEVPRVPHAHRRRPPLLVGDRRRPAVQYRLQIPIDPFIPSHSFPIQSTQTPLQQHKFSLNSLLYQSKATKIIINRRSHLNGSCYN